MQETIQINDKMYEIASLPPVVQELVAVYRKWISELNDARLEVAKHEAAIRDLAGEINRAMASVEAAAAQEEKQAEAEQAAE